MAHVVTERCAGCRYTYCVANCPVDCFWEITEPRHMLVIDPGECIVCNACIPDCPVNAIFPEEELPPAYAEWRAFNAEHVAHGTNVVKPGDPLPTARALDEIQAAERARGLEIVEPSLAS